MTQCFTQKIYVTTWNVGFSEPPENIGKTNENFLGEAYENLMIIIGLQECKANSWIDFFQNKLKSKNKLLPINKIINIYIDDFMCVYQERVDKLREKH